MKGRFLVEDLNVDGWIKPKLFRDIREINCEVGDWIQLAQDRAQWQDFVKNGSEHLDSLN
jgi:hypothetical protein